MVDATVEPVPGVNVWIVAQHWRAVLFKGTASARHAEDRTGAPHHRARTAGAGSSSLARVDVAVRAIGRRGCVWLTGSSGGLKSESVFAGCQQRWLRATGTTTSELRGPRASLRPLSRIS